MPDLAAPYFAPRPLTGRVAGRIVEAWIGRTSLETESLPRYDDPEATGSVTGVPEQQDGQEKDQGDGVPISLQANKEDATQLKSLPVSTPQALGSEKEQQNQEEQGKSLSNNSHEYFTSGYSQHFIFPHPNSRRNSYSVPRRSHETSARSSE